MMVTEMITKETFAKWASTFCFKVVNEQQVLNVINNFKDKKASGPDRIPAILWKIIADHILKPFTYTLSVKRNLSLLQGDAH